MDAVSNFMNDTALKFMSDFLISGFSKVLGVDIGMVSLECTVRWLDL